MRLLALSMLLMITLFATAASADNTVTYTATQTIPVPPASNYAGTGGGDGWNVALTPAAVYNVFHHSGSWQVACHRQADAKPCWPAFNGDTSGRALNVIDADRSISTSGHSGVVIDPSTGKLYGFGTRSDGLGGLVCVDTNLASPTVDPFAAGAANPFCGFTPVTGVRESVTGTSGMSETVRVGSRLFAFNFVPGNGVGPGGQNKLVCFDLNTSAACQGQPFTLDVGSGTNNNGTFPAPAVAQFGGRIVVPITMGGTARLACFDAEAMAACSGTWPVTLTGGALGYPGSYGAPFPKLTASGTLIGLCLPMPTIPCFTLEGGSSATPDSMPSGVTSTSGWNSASVVVGPRVYIPHGYYPNSNVDQVDCYDYNLGAGCTGFPKHFDGLSLLYSVNSDPQRPACLWVNSDGGTQIQNFDAFNGGVCGEGPIRVLASSFVVDTPLCTPGSWTRLQVTTPARNTYTTGSVAFQDASGIAIPGADDVQLDNTGTADLSGLDLAKGTGLPQFLITLTGPQGKPGEVVVQVGWTGAFDPSCLAKPGTSVINPPSSASTGPPPKSDLKVTVSAPTVARTGKPQTFTAIVTNGGPNTSTGVVLRTPVPANATLVSASATAGDGCTLGATATCFLGTMAPGASVTVKMVFTTGQVGPLTISPSVEGDYDTNPGNNSSSVTATVVSPTAPPSPPPPSSAPGTFNAVGSGTIKVNGVDQPADQLFVLHSGDIVDVTNGVLTFTGSDGSYITVSSTQLVASLRTGGGSATADNLPAQFKVEQPATTGEVTTLTLVGGDFATCNAPRSTSATNPKPIRQLWGSAKGKFRTVGQYSAATVRGTVWLTQDRCDGTLTQVVESIVDVLDVRLQKTIAVNPGESYLATPKPAAFKPPASKGSAQKRLADRIKKSGLAWAGQRFLHRKAFEAWLTARGGTWQQFQSKYPVLAAALSARH